VWMLQAALAEAEAAQGERASLKEQLEAAKATLAGEQWPPRPCCLPLVQSFALGCRLCKDTTLSKALGYCMAAYMDTSRAGLGVHLQGISRRQGASRAATCWLVLLQNCRSKCLSWRRWWRLARRSLTRRRRGWRSSRRGSRSATRVSPVWICL
jgi:hypothetical protein